MYGMYALQESVRQMRGIAPAQVPDDGLTSAPLREGLTIDGWQDTNNPTLNGKPIHLEPYDIARSVAIGPDAKRFFLGSIFALAAFDDAGTRIWEWPSRNEIWPVNVSRD